MDRETQEWISEVVNEAIREWEASKERADIRRNARLTRVRLDDWYNGIVTRYGRESWTMPPGP